MSSFGFVTRINKFLTVAPESSSPPETASLHPPCRCRSKFLSGCEGQAAFAVEQFLQPAVAGTALAPDDAGRNELAALAPGTPAFEPVRPTDGTFNRNAGGF